VATITVPVLEETFTCTVWGKTYTAQVRGNTVINISPRNPGARSYPIYQRDFMRATTAPMIRKTLYIPSRRIEE
jgi:hypothetical protein